MKPRPGSNPDHPAVRHTAVRGVSTLLLAIGIMANAFAAAPDAAPSRYTFSWPVGPDAPAPRGGTTRGAPVTLVTEPTAEWQALQAPGISPQERDRRAILAMAGSYRVAFDFLEIANFSGDGTRPRPYQSWGTEKVYVDRNEPGLISLVHILELRVVQADGTVTEPMVQKHWRQQWRYEPAWVVENTDGDTWKRRDLKQAERSGAWSQQVFQVDESPRYGALGRWQHTASFSSWVSGETARPLPRREWSTRKDYQVLSGTNRHTILPRGWLQEENNLKQVAPATAQTFVGREYGVARYERLQDADFAAADQYYNATRQFWDQVLQAWDGIWARQREVKVANSDQSGDFALLFELADEFEAINSIYGDGSLVPSDEDPADYVLNLHNLDEGGGDGPATHHHHAPSSSVKLQFPPAYPAEPPAVLGTHSAGEGGARSGDAARELEMVRLAVGVAFRPGEVCLFDAIEELRRVFAEEAAAEGDERGLGGELDGEPGSEGRDDDPDEGVVAARGRAPPSVPPDLPSPPPWTLSDPVTGLRSTFLARVAPASSPAQAAAFIAHLLSTDRRARSATHNISAWRMRGAAGTGTSFQDCDDDGETAAGGRLLHLMQVMDVWDAVVVVTRWYGGHKLGPRRFAIINTVARDGFVKAGMVVEGGGGGATAGGGGSAKKKHHHQGK